MRIRQKTVIEQMDAAERIKATDESLCRRAIVEAGWEPESHDFGVVGNSLIAHRATQRAFKTPWLLNWSEVLDYIQGKAKGEK